MKAKLLKQLRTNASTKTTLKYTTFFVCIVIAASVWLLLELGKSYSTEITVPINYSNYPSNKLLINKPANKFNLKVKAKGSRLIKHKLFGLKEALNVDLSLLKIDKSDNIAHFPAAKNQESFKEQLGNKIQLLGIYPESLNFQFSDIITQKKEVIFKSKITYKQQYMKMGAIKITPEYINVSGPFEGVDTLQNVFTELIKIDDLNKTRTIEVKLVNGNEYLKYSPEKITIHIPVEQFTENEIEVPIDSIFNLPKDIIARLFPKKVKLIYTVPLSKYDRVFEKNFVLGINFNESKNYTAKRLNVELLKKPAYIKLIRMEPNKVEYFIQK